MAVKKETVKEVVKRKVTPNKREPKTTLFYIGPTVKRGMLENGSNFRGGIPKEVEALKKEFPTIAHLFVEKEDYVKSLKDTKIAGTRMNILYAKAQEEVSK